MWYSNRFSIIIDKESIKPIWFLGFSGLDVFIMCGGFFIAYYPLKLIFNELVGVAVGIGVFVILGFLLIEMPDHLSIIQHIQMWYSYRFKEPREFFYIPKSEVNKSEKQELDKETLEWMEYKNMIQANREKRMY